MHKLRFTDEAKARLATLEKDKGQAKRLKKIRRTLGLIETNLRHPSLNTHKYSTLEGPDGEEVFEAYVENRTSGAFRVFFYYGPGKGLITILAITPHP